MQVKDAQLMYDKETRRHRGNIQASNVPLLDINLLFLAGFGFVTFESDEAVDEVCSIQYHDIRNKKVTLFP